MSWWQGTACREVCICGEECQQSWKNSILGNISNLLIIKPQQIYLTESFLLNILSRTKGSSRSWIIVTFWVPTTSQNLFNKLYLWYLEPHPCGIDTVVSRLQVENRNQASKQCVRSVKRNVFKALLIMGWTGFDSSLISAGVWAWGLLHGTSWHKGKGKEREGGFVKKQIFWQGFEGYWTWGWRNILFPCLI